MRGLQVWGRWWSQAHPRHCWKTPQGWSLPSKVHVPWPCGCLVSPKSPWPKDVWAAVPTVPTPLFKQGDGDDPETEASGSDTSIVVTSNGEAEEETPDDGLVELLAEFLIVAGPMESVEEDNNLEATAWMPMWMCLMMWPILTVRMTILAAYLVEHYPGSVVVIRYADDILIEGKCPVKSNHRRRPRSSVWSGPCWS